MKRLSLTAFLLWAPICAQQTPPLLVKPYLQLGNAPDDATRMDILWHTADAEAEWAVEYRTNGGEWTTAGKPVSRRIAPPAIAPPAKAPDTAPHIAPHIAPHHLYRVQLTGLSPGRHFEYRLLAGGNVVFSSQGMARKSARQSYRVGIFGDIAQGTVNQRMVAYELSKTKPDMVFVTGDIVYSRGRIAEYRERFFNCYNADQAQPEAGAPLLRSTLFVAAPGNHDVATADLATYPDALAYFYYWAQPLNGPPLTAGGPHTLKLVGPEENLKAFRAAAGDNYPQMSNFSFDYGNAHWTVLDADPFLNWSAPELRAWLKNDLAAARKATWRFVGFHHPGFNSSIAHFKEQQMRPVSDVFEEGKVDIVFSGHVHNYQRTFAMTYSPASKEWTLDKEFDGGSKSRPKGVIYIVTGAGGAKLYNPEQQDKPETWQPFTHRFISQVNSFTQIDVEGKRLELRQISESGQELDRMVITK